MREDACRSLILGFELIYFPRPYLGLLGAGVFKVSVFGLIMAF